MDIQVFPRHAIERGLKFHDPYVVISITTFKSDIVDIPDSDSCLAILRLHFPDIDSPISGDPYIFSSAQARSVWEFVDDVKDEIKHIAVQCDMGKYRSPAIAAALAKILTGDETPFFKNYSPNKHVFKLMMQAYYEKQN